MPPRWLEAPRPARIADLLTVALLAALVAVQTLGDGQAIVVDARVPAVARRRGTAAAARAVPRRRRSPRRSSRRCCGCGLGGVTPADSARAGRLAGCAPRLCPRRAPGSWPSSSAPSTGSPARSRTRTCSAGSRSVSCSPIIGSAALLVAVRLLTSDRWAALATGLGMMIATLVFSGRGPGGSVIVPAERTRRSVWTIARADPRGDRGRVADRRARGRRRAPTPWHRRRRIRLIP